MAARKTYATRKNAKIAAEKEGINAPDIKVNEITAKNFETLGVPESQVGRFVWTDAGEARREREVKQTMKELDEDRAFKADIEDRPVSKWDRDEIEVDVDTEEATVTLSVDGEEIVEVEQKPVNSLEANRGHSTIEKPVATVHQICAEMDGARRKDVIAACVALGINVHTARTQYQVWFKKQRAATAVAK